MKSNRHARLGAGGLTTWIMIGMLLGIGVGYICHEQAPDARTAKEIAGYFSLLTEIFMRLIKMIIAPLVFSTLVSGIAGMTDSSSIGRIGLRAMLWFIGASVISLLLGMLFVNWLQVGHALNLPLSEPGVNVGVSVAGFNLKDFIAHIFPKSLFEAMAQNEVLQIVVFSLFFGVALRSFHDETANSLILVICKIARVMLKCTDYVMVLAPVAVFGAIASVIAVHGLKILTTYGKYLGGFYLALAMLWLLLIGVGYVFLGRSVVRLMKLIREPIMVAFSTGSSEAAFPRLLEQLKQFGISEKISGFVLPLGYSFNLDGSMMYTAFASLFIAQAYGIDMPLSQQLMMLAVLMISSKGIASVPRASLVVVASVLPMFNLPEAGVALILGVDQFLDMGRTATNVVGNSIATSVIARWEDQAE